MTDASFEDPVDYFGMELLLLLLSLLDTLLLFMILWLNGITMSVHVFINLFNKPIKPTNNTKSGSTAVKLSYR